MNIIQIAGHLGADPESRFTPSGQKVTTLRVATNIRKGGKDETIWFRVTIWGDRFDKMLTYFKKGSAIIVVGEMGKPEIYTDREGRPQVSIDVTAELIRFSPFGKPNQDQNAPNNQNASNNNRGYAPAAPGAQQSQAMGAPMAGIAAGSYGGLTGSGTDAESEEEMPF